MKKFLLLTILCILCLSYAEPSAAKVYIDLEAPAVEKLPIAVQGFRYMGAEPASQKEAELLRHIRSEILGTLKSDLDFAGLFKTIDNDAFLEDPGKAGFFPEEISFRDWRMIGADALIEGRFTIEGKKLIVEVKLFDCVREKTILGKRYIGSTSKPRRLAHFFSDRLYMELTGRPGVFTTKMLFVSKRTGNKEVYLSDYDGKNAVQITHNRSINLSPRWSPDGKKILYTSYKKGYPYLYMLNIRTGRETVISKKQGINIGGRFSPDGDLVALTMSARKSPELYLLELSTGRFSRLTNNYSIDVSPTWSPDGKKIAFVSDRSGNPHIFVLELPTGSTRRLTYKGKYNSSPAWSPDGKKIAFACSENTGFHICLTDPEDGRPLQITYEGNNKNPSWSPDGRFIVFSRTIGDKTQLYIMQSDGRGIRSITTGVGGETTPAWSPFLH